MPALIRKTDSAVFVPRADSAANQDGKPAPHPHWLLADGQPPECQRVRVRALTAQEIAGEVTVGESCDMGLIDIDGTACTPDELTASWRARIGELVSAVTYLPLAGPGSESTASPSPAPIGSPDSPKSS